MVQFYFLSIIANLLGGFALASDYFSEKFKGLSSFKSFFEKRGTRITLGSLALIVGIFKLIVKPVGWAVPFVGDMLPAFTGIAVGFVLLLDFFKEKSETGKDKLEKVEKTVMTYRVPLGILSVVVAIVHFLIPGALIL